MTTSPHHNPPLQYVLVVILFLGLTAAVAIVPAAYLAVHVEPVPGSKPMTASEKRGQDTYIAEGCAYCHTQQVRPLPVDSPVFGRPSAPGDYARLRPLGVWRMVPEITGTERTGPDLADVGSRQPSRAWNYIHLYDPRAVSPASVMQAFPWMFAVVEKPDSSAEVVAMPKGFQPPSGKVVVTPTAKHLVDYILSRKQTPIPGLESSMAPPSSGTPSSSKSSRSASSSKPASIKRGSQIYASRCASCHQSDGDGIPGTFPPLEGAPAVTATDPTEQIRIVLFGLSGQKIKGKSYSGTMPSHTSMSDQEIADVINYERTSWGNNAPTVTAKQVHEVRQKGSGKQGS